MSPSSFFDNHPRPFIHHSVMMAPGNSPDHQRPFTSNSMAGQGTPETGSPGDSSSGQHSLYNSPAVCGVVAQFPLQGQFSSMYGSAATPFSGEHQIPSRMPVEHQQTHMGYRHHQTEMTQDDQSGHAMATIQSIQGAQNNYPPCYLDAMDAGARYTSGFHNFSQARSFTSQEVSGMSQTSMALAATPTTLLCNGEARAFKSIQGRREFPWTDRHTVVLRQGKRAGKSVPDIVKDLYQIDGVERTPNLVSKRWGKMRQGCISKHVSTYPISLVHVHHEDGRGPNIEGSKRPLTRCRKWTRLST